MKGELKHYSYRLVGRNGQTFHNIGINKDGSLWNPNGYPEEEARAAALYADEKRHQRRIEARKRGVETAKRRREERIAKITRDFLLGKHIGNLDHCANCGKALADSISIERGLGSECWPRLMDRLAKAVPNCEQHLSTLQVRLKDTHALTYEGWREKHGYRERSVYHHDRLFAMYSREKYDAIGSLEREIKDAEILLAAARRWRGIDKDGLFEKNIAMGAH